MPLPEPVVPDDERRAGAERDGSAFVGVDVADVVVAHLVGAVARQLHPQHRVLGGVEDGAVHLDGAADAGVNVGRRDVGDGRRPLPARHRRHHGGDEGGRERRDAGVHRKGQWGVT